MENHRAADGEADDGTEGGYQHGVRGPVEDVGGDGAEGEGHA